MQFLNPIWLLALPLMFLPIVIHLLNQRRHRTIEWGAMQFLLSARRMSRGMARLKQWLIMATRMLAIGGLIFVISRPLSSGWIGALSGGKPETVIVLLDRSASMQHQQLATGETKLSTGIKKMASTLETVVGKKPLVLIESTANQASTVDTPAGLLDLPNTAITESRADIGVMMQTALDYITDNQAGRTDIWICSDAAENDWNAQSSRWKALNTGFSKLEGVRFHVLNFPQPPADNLSVVVDQVSRVTQKDKTELVIDLTVNRPQQAGASLASVTVPLTFTINGLRSVMDFTIDGQTNSLIGHRIPIDAEQAVGWGKVELPTDSNGSDNSWYFAFADPVPRKTVIISEKKSITRAIHLATATSSQSAVEFESVVLPPERVSEVNWQETSMLVWQAPLPTGTVAKQIRRFVDSGRTAIFLPPELTDETSFAGMQWTQWNRTTGKQGSGMAISFWNNDEDLLARTRSGNALPVNELLIYRHCKLKINQPDLTPVLAKLNASDELLVRRRSGAGSMYFLTTWPVATHSSLDREGVTLFAMLHRAIAAGAESQGAARQFEAGTLPAREVETLGRLDLTAHSTAGAADQPPNSVANLSQSRPFRAGVYGTERQMIALNRPLAEDQSSALATPELEALFAGLDFALIDGKVGSGQSLASEIWRVFVALMAVALLVEALLCMPAKPTAKVNLQPTSTRAGGSQGPKTPSDDGKVAA